MACALFCFSSCKNQKAKEREQIIQQQEELAQPTEMEVNGYDTTEVLNLTKLYLSKVKSKDYDGAVNMLYYLNKDKIVSLPPSLSKKFKQSLEAFPIFDYRIDFLKFFKETDSEVKFTYIIQDPKSVKEGSKPAEMSGMIRPVRRDGKWYLTLADTETDSTYGSELDK